MWVSKQKEKLRKKLLSRRSDIPEHEWETASERIAQKVLQLNEIRTAEVIHCYVSMNARNEVNTHPIISNFLEAGKKVAVSVSDLKEGTLSHYFIESLAELSENAWGVLEPDPEYANSAGNFDCVLVPMVGADRMKNRLGYGKGFYDRFLSASTATKIGLCFDDCLEEQIPTEAFDVPLDIIITESEVI